MDAAPQQIVGIDRSSEIPYYLQLSRLLEQQMETGTFAPGARLPSESELCSAYGLARSTVREMLRHLADQGRIKLVPRRGAFVVERVEPGWRLQVTQGFFEVEVDQHRQVETRVLQADRCALTGRAAEALEVEPGTHGFKLARVRRLDGQLALYSVNYLLAEIEPLLRQSDVLSGAGSLNKTLQSGGYETYRARRSVEAVGAPPEIAQRLEIPPGQPVLLVTSVAWDRRNRPFDFYTSWLRSDVVKVTVEATAAGGG